MTPIHPPLPRLPPPRSASRSPIWEVSSGALKAVASSRLCHLALPRPAAAGWQPDHPLAPTVSNKPASLPAKQLPLHPVPQWKSLSRRRSYRRGHLLSYHFTVEQGRQNEKLKSCLLKSVEKSKFRIKKLWSLWQHEITCNSKKCRYFLPCLRYYLQKFVTHKHRKRQCVCVFRRGAHLLFLSLGHGYSRPAGTSKLI